MEGGVGPEYRRPRLDDAFRRKGWSKDNSRAGGQGEESNNGELHVWIGDGLKKDEKEGCDELLAEIGGLWNRMVMAV